MSSILYRRWSKCRAETGVGLMRQKKKKEFEKTIDNYI
jgi:hypothetical protein